MRTRRTACFRVHAYLLTEIRFRDLDELQRIPGTIPAESRSDDRGDTVGRDHGSRQLQVVNDSMLLLLHLLLTSVHHHHLCLLQSQQVNRCGRPLLLILLVLHDQRLDEMLHDSLTQQAALIGTGIHAHTDSG